MWTVLCLPEFTMIRSYKADLAVMAGSQNLTSVRDWCGLHHSHYLSSQQPKSKELEKSGFHFTGACSTFPYLPVDADYCPLLFCKGISSKHTSQPALQTMQQHKSFVQSDPLKWPRGEFPTLATLLVARDITQIHWASVGFYSTFFLHQLMLSLIQDGNFKITHHI